MHPADPTRAPARSRAGRAQSPLRRDTGRVSTLYWRRRALFLAVLAVLGTLFGIMHAREANRPVLTRQEHLHNFYLNTISREDVGWLQQLLDEGADVDQQLDGNYTPAALAARFISWPLVLFLLQRGTAPDLVSV